MIDLLHHLTDADIDPVLIPIHTDTTDGELLLSNDQTTNIEDESKWHIDTVTDTIDKEYFYDNDNRFLLSWYRMIDMIQFDQDMLDIQHHSEQIKHHIPELDINQCKAYHVIHGFLKQGDQALLIYHKDVYFIIEKYLHFCNFEYHSHEMQQKIKT